MMGIVTILERFLILKIRETTLVTAKNPQTTTLFFLRGYTHSIVMVPDAFGKRFYPDVTGFHYATRKRVGKSKQKWQKSKKWKRAKPNTRWGQAVYPTNRG